MRIAIQYDLDTQKEVEVIGVKRLNPGILAALFMLPLLNALMSSMVSAKPVPVTFEEQVQQSNLIAVVKVTSLTDGGKQGQSNAIVELNSVLKRSTTDKRIEIHWVGSAITGIGEWLIFAKQDKSAITLTYGVLSAWQILYADSDDNSFVPVVPIMGYVPLTTSKPLIEKFNVYLHIPTELNPINLEAIAVDTLRKAIETFPVRDSKELKDES